MDCPVHCLWRSFCLRLGCVIPLTRRPCHSGSCPTAYRATLQESNRDEESSWRSLREDDKKLILGSYKPLLLLCSRNATPSVMMVARSLSLVAGRGAPSSSKVSGSRLLLDSKKSCPTKCWHTASGAGLQRVCRVFSAHAALRSRSDTPRNIHIPRFGCSFSTYTSQIPESNMVVTNLAGSIRLRSSDTMPCFVS